MKKSLFLLAAASAIMLTACTSENEVVQSAPQQESGPQAVAFDTYTSEATRAGQAGVMTTSTLKSTGFGVFAQYSNGDGTTDGAYSNSVNPTNFMWNEKVSYSTGWTYSPLKYWPNETDNDSQGFAPVSDPNGNAESKHADKLSFFAYAPYVAELPSVYTGKLDIDQDGSNQYDGTPEINDSHIKTARIGGIEAVIANNTTGNDPWVRYSVAETPSKSVDLLWGVAPAGKLSYANVAHGTTEINAGWPLVDLIKPAKDQKIKFLFQHALARIGLQVVAAVDQISPGGALNENTIIAVKSVSIAEATTTNFTRMKGTLNLKNTAAYKSLWSNTGSKFSATVTNADELNPDIAYKTSASVTWGKHQDHLANSETYTWTGVTTSEADVIAAKKYFMVIPNNDETNNNADQNVNLDVNIKYVVITADPKLAGGYSEVDNDITKTVTISKFTNNKAYNLKLILGLTSVKLDAEVADWEVDGSTEVYLPQNNE